MDPGYCSSHGDWGMASGAEAPGNPLLLLAARARDTAGICGGPQAESFGNSSFRQNILWEEINLVMEQSLRPGQEGRT